MPRKQGSSAGGMGRAPRSGLQVPDLLTAEAPAVEGLARYRVPPCRQCALAPGAQGPFGLQIRQIGNCCSSLRSGHFSLSGESPTQHSATTSTTREKSIETRRIGMECDNPIY
jgi:hypothetical protein